MKKYVYENEFAENKKKFNSQNVNKISARITIDAINWICFKTHSSIVFLNLMLNFILLGMDKGRKY